MNKDLKTQIAERISVVLEQKGLKQQDLADSTGMTKSYISQIMHGTVNLTVETIGILEKALGEKVVQIPPK